MLGVSTFGYDLAASRAFWEAMRLYWMPLASLSAWTVLVVRGIVVDRAHDDSGRVAWVAAFAALPPFAFAALLWFFRSNPDW